MLHASISRVCGGSRRLLALALVSTILGQVAGCGAPRSPTATLDATTNTDRHFVVPKFETTAAEVQAALATATQQLNAAVATIVNSAPATRNFANTFGALDNAEHAFGGFTSRMGILNSASSIAAVRDATSDAGVKAGDAFMAAVSLNRDLYLVLAEVAETAEAKALTGESARLISETIKSYKNNGMALNDSDRQQLAALQSQMAELTTKMSDNLKNDEGIIRLQGAELEGLTADQLARIDRDAATGEYLLHTATADMEIMVLENAKIPQTRQKVLIAAETRAKDSNGPLFVELLNLRLKTAHLLGYGSWADYRIANNMAKNAANARALVTTINTRLDPKFNQEKQALIDLKRQDLGLSANADVTFALEDVRYYLNKLLLTKYHVDTEALKAYFPEKPAMRGVFAIYEELFGIKFEATTSPYNWSDEVSFYAIHDAKTNEVLGGIYFDLYPRDGKYKHFAMFPLVNGKLMADGHYEAPLSAMIGNWPRPVDGQPALWTHDQLITFAHELGHGLHHVLTKGVLDSFSGMNVPVDFVEAPSQAFERWVQDAAVLNRFAAHYQTGAKIPTAMVDALVASRKAATGHHYKRQLAFDFMDLRIHSYTDAAQIPSTPAQLYAATNADLAVYYPDYPQSAFVASFGHLFGGYDAGYYSYAWADVISAEIAQQFRSAPGGFMDKNLGAKLRQEILQVGGTRDVDDSVRAFLGRDFNTDAFFKELLP